MYCKIIRIFIPYHVKFTFKTRIPSPLLWTYVCFNNALLQDIWIVLSHFHLFSCLLKTLCVLLCCIHNLIFFLNSILFNLFLAFLVSDTPGELNFLHVFHVNSAFALIPEVTHFSVNGCCAHSWCFQVSKVHTGSSLWWMFLNKASWKCPKVVFSFTGTFGKGPSGKPVSSLHREFNKWTCEPDVLGLIVQWLCFLALELETLLSSFSAGHWVTCF